MPVRAPAEDHSSSVGPRAGRSRDRRRPAPIARFWDAVSRLATAASLPCDHDGGREPRGDRARACPCAWMQPRRRPCSSDVPAAYRTADQRRAAHRPGSSACAPGRHENRFVIDLEGHGREDLFEGVDVSRTVGWFTTLYPGLGSRRAAADEGAALKSVKEQLRAVPRPRPELRRAPLPRHRTESRRAARRCTPAGPALQLSRPVRPGRGRLVAVPFRAGVRGPWHGPARGARHALEVLALVRGRPFEARFDLRRGAHGRETIERLAESFVDALRGARSITARRRSPGLHAVGLPARAPRPGGAGPPGRRRTRSRTCARSRRCSGSSTRWRRRARGSASRSGGSRLQGATRCRGPPRRPGRTRSRDTRSCAPRS